MITKTHSYFLLKESSLPLLNSINSFNLLFSLSMFFKFSLIVSLLTSVSLLTLSMMAWWLTYLKEFSLMGFGSSSLEEGIKMGMILFICSEIFFFFSFFWSYFHYFLSPSLESGFQWPPQGVLSFEAINVPFLNTLILLSSGIFVTLSHKFLNINHKSKSNLFLSLTILFGLTFTFFQMKEYQSSFFSLSDGNYGTTFFMLTGFHGLHVIIGSIFLLKVLMLSLSFNSPSKLNFLSFELSCWYWHFVDVVWLFLFFILYYLND